MAYLLEGAFGDGPRHKHGTTTRPSGFRNAGAFMGSNLPERDFGGPGRADQRAGVTRQSAITSEYAVIQE